MSISNPPRSQTRFRFIASDSRSARPPTHRRLTCEPIDLAVERLEQRYVRLDNDGAFERYHYAASGFDFECELSYDQFGLVLDYPGIATRAA